MDELLFDWDAANIGHIAAHGVVPEEAEEILLGNPMEVDFDEESGEKRWSYVGETVAGRILRVLFTIRNDHIRVVTAFDPSPLQKRIFLAWRAKQS
jgi:hypothetical protein